MTTEQATFAAGCFWGVEKAFVLTKGVVSTKVGYTGGHTVNPTYQEVCTGTTNHAEAVLVTFDPERISYRELLDVFWNVHDPTQFNRQGWDVGTQYRSTIFYHNEVQREIAEKSMMEAQNSGRFSKPIVTRIEKVLPFYDAEDYHQRYWESHPISCHL